MSEIYGWMRNVVYCLCLLELLYHLVRSPEYQRYLRFFGGMVFLLVTLGPLLDVFKIQEKLDRVFQGGMRMEEIRELQESADSLMELKNEKIRDACLSELERQIKELATDQGTQVTDVEAEVNTEGESGWKVEEIRIFVKGKHSRSENGETQTENGSQLRSTVSAVYGLPEERVLVYVKE